MTDEVYSRGIVFPNKFKAELSDDKSSGRFTISPLQHGFGTTIGNILRRTLLSSIRGVAVDNMKIGDARHEYDILQGVREEVAEIIYNVRRIVWSTENDQVNIRFSVQGPKKVYASDIQTPSDVKILNPKQYLFEITDNKKIDVEMNLVAGIGDDFVYQNEETDLDVIHLDKHFSPVLHVNQEIRQTRVDKKTDYDMLVMDVKTNGSIDADKAFEVAISVLSSFLNAVSVSKVRMFNESENAISSSAEISSEDSGFNYYLLRKIDDLELSVRSQNCLKNDGILFIGDLVKRNEADMLRTPNFGRKSLNELKAILASMHLKFGMNIDWPLKEDEMRTRLAEAAHFFDKQ